MTMVATLLMLGAIQVVAASPFAQCELRQSGDHWTGSCGRIFNEEPTFTLARAPAITTGAWRKDVRPEALWAGKLINAGDPDYPVELEIYPGHTGVIRTEYGWYAVADFSSSERNLRFRIDTSHELEPNDVDRAILERAKAILNSPKVWNRADNRRCSAGATSWSIYCALADAAIDVTGGFNHRRPAAELVRKIVEERSKGRGYHHRLMDYNNDPATTFADVQSVFAQALTRIHP